MDGAERRIEGNKGGSGKKVNNWEKLTGGKKLGMPRKVYSAKY